MSFFFTRPVSYKVPTPTVGNLLQPRHQRREREDSPVAIGVWNYKDVRQDAYQVPRQRKRNSSDISPPSAGFLLFTI